MFWETSTALFEQPPGTIGFWNLRQRPPTVCMGYLVSSTRTLSPLLMTQWRWWSASPTVTSWCTGHSGTFENLVYGEQCYAKRGLDRGDYSSHHITIAWCENYDHNIIGYPLTSIMNMYHAMRDNGFLKQGSPMRCPYLVKKKLFHRQCMWGRYTECIYFIPDHRVRKSNNSGLSAADAASLHCLCGEGTLQ